jgi:hypothetical protein
MMTGMSDELLAVYGDEDLMAEIRRRNAEREDRERAEAQRVRLLSMPRRGRRL